MYYHPDVSALQNSVHKMNASMRECLISSNECDPFWGQHKYKLTKSEIEIIFEKDLYIQIIKSKAFQRLKDIRFLGSIDYVYSVNSNKRVKKHTRYHHSLSVARLALQYAKEKGLSEKDENLCVVSALLHDIGHAPLSHSLESVFKENFGIGHHIAGEKIIKGEVELGQGLNKVLSQWGINPFEIMMIVSGKAGSPFGDIFNYSINIDTIEGVLRSTTYLFEKQVFYAPSQILSALINLSESSYALLDDFWQLKDIVYSELINNKVGVLADYVCQEYMRTHSDKFKKEYYYGYEKNLIKKHKLLFDRLLAVGNNESKVSASTKMTYTKRRFVVKKNVRLEDKYSLNKRYVQYKEDGIIKINL